MLKAKLDAFARMLQMQRQLEQKSAELEQYYHAAEEEQRVGAHLMNQMVRADMPREPLLSYWIQPARNLSGDLVVATRTPDGVLHVLLADGTGHGLAASLNVLSIVDPFYAMTARGASLGTIASEVNGKIKRWLPIERYVAATLIAFDPAAERLEHLKRALAGHFAGGSANDDMAIAIIDCAPQPAAPRREEVPSVSVSGVCAGGGWRVRTRVTAQELKYLDVAPFLLEVVRRFHGIEAHAAQILLILSELFNNALDHGLLELDSRIKREPGGVERFLAMRRHRLDELSEGSVDIELEMIAAGNRPMLAIRIQDSGRGFDYRPLLAAGAGISASAVPHGRGIALVRNLCARLEYHGSGNGVSALYDLAQGI